jgi:zinc transporter ZupT
MNNYFLPIIAVLAGGLLIFLWRPKELRSIKLLLAFSGAFLLGTTLTSLLPSVFISGSKHISYWILAGIIIQIVLEQLSKGAEHGHIHTSEKRIPLTLLIGLYLHAFIEGFPIHQYNDLLWAIVIHKLPIAMLLTLAIWQTNFSQFKNIIILIGFAIMTPLGSYLNSYTPVLHPYNVHITALVVGVLLHISTTILFESSENHKFNISKLLVIIIGIGLSILQH